ncbi:MAG: tRNA (guanosine(46)-N7)-methyltransferase TrmB [Bacteroidaceae bacterium]|nr:tRNA (guanosine(46)-N7)-methyltransferase TrmB [Bacteroidaceae bacterium]
MAKGKLAKFADMASYENVFEYPYSVMQNVPFAMKGHWHEQYFKNSNPIVLELGCGKGEYTVGLARKYTDRNFIGVDIKGARMWTGATQAVEEKLENVAFLRTNIELIDRFFTPGEVSEIWITFADPQMKKVTKRLTSTMFLERYRKILKENGLVHLKTDSNFLFTYTEYMAEHNGLNVLFKTRNLYNSPEATADNDFATLAASIQTYYESQWIDRGIDIKYMVFELPQEGALTESEKEIPLDEYRSYHRDKRSTKDTSK